MAELRDIQLLVGKFMTKHGMRRSPHSLLLRFAMVQEELAETMQAYCLDPDDQDSHELADGLGDLLFTVIGLAWTLNLDLEPLILEVCRSNLTKKVSGDERVKDKGELYSPPVFGDVRSFPR